MRGYELGGATLCTRCNLTQTLCASSSLVLRVSLCVQLARLANRHFRCAKDATVRGRRVVREVAAYWRRSERDAWETRRRADREEAELTRRQFEQREADRQKKKLEFLLTQTELYSHFIGRKMGIIPDEAAAKPAAANTAAAAADGGSADGAANSAAANGTAAPAAAAPADASASSDTAMSDAPVPLSAATAKEVAPAVSDAAMSSLLAHASTVKNEHDVSAEDAARNYIRNQQAKMAQFDQLEANATAAAAASSSSSAAAAAPASPGGTAAEAAPAGAASASPAVPAGADSLDLLNPSTMPEQESFVQAAASFNGTLKSYQLRGLNWLLNLYEQGINGILADGLCHTHSSTAPVPPISTFSLVLHVSSYLVHWLSLV